MNRLAKSKPTLAILIVVVIAMTATITALLVNMVERKTEATKNYERLVEVGENDTDPETWKANWPRQYDGYMKTALSTRTRFGGHGGSEALPEQKIERDPWLKRMFKGYAFSIDYRDRRGHAYMLQDQAETERQTKPQSGSCLHCHASLMPLYRELGDGDAMKGFEGTNKYSYQELYQLLEENGNAHPVSCVDCHSPKTMEIRVTRPGFILGIQALAESDVPVPHLQSIERWRAGSKNKPYDPNLDASRGELRSYVCGQCHVEYYCGSNMTLTFPWGEGLKVEQVESFWDNLTFPNGDQFYDYTHAESGAKILKAQHPEFELWSQGLHARSGVACADCHMPYMRDGASKISDHWVRSPLLNVNRACQTCHRFSEAELLERVDHIQERNFELLQRAGAALMGQLDAIADAKSRGATESDLQPSLDLQRKAQWRLDFIAAENSMGFHAPQEAARILGEAIDYAHRGSQIATAWSE
ncbi:MAG: ammonia-forming cytochrome c nitrite reductase subunit c552 [FCB group bacterium]|nr:ammonia-forming cytochrome c nitrite reductase subunit c552 [FCB group bacterium]MBL7024522.1 ammonia-forming cytochrome c nitrite reductase subunit c552 [Candidatus Neomarinimicrobiota bacterium]